MLQWYAFVGACLAYIALTNFFRKTLLYRLSIFRRCCSFDLFEGFYEVAKVIETTGEGNLRYTHVGIDEFSGGSFYAVEFQILHRRFGGHLLKKRAYIFPRHAGSSCNILQGDGRMIIPPYER